MAAVPEPLTTKQIAQKSLQANREHQHALKCYIEHLEAELQTADNLLSAAEIADQEDEPELDVKGFVLIPGAKKVTSPLGAHELLLQDSPFREDAEKRLRYLGFTSIHSMKAKELDVLAEAVRTENSRIYAFEAQQCGHDPFSRPNLSQIKVETNTEGLDWERIAEKVSTVSSTTRTARECEIRWVGNRHPIINHASWPQTELARLKALISDRFEGPINWVDIAKKLGTNRTPIDCMRHAIQRRHHLWDTQSDQRLLEAVKIYGTNNWNLVARYTSEDATAQQCSSRYMRTLDPALKRGTWTAEEDSRLRLAVAAYGNSWIDVAAVVPGRNAEQCRDRWLDRINPNLAKGLWTDEEDGKLMEAVGSLGASWSDVSEWVGNGRTDQLCRLRYEALKKKQSSATAGSSMFTPTPNPTREEPQDRPARSKPRSRTRKTPATASPDVGDDSPAIQSSRPKPKPRTNSKGKDKDVVTAEGDVTTRTDTSEIGQPPPPRPKPRPRTKNKGKGKEAVAESGSMERGPQKNVVDDSMSTTTTEVGRSLKDNDKGPVRDPSLPDEQGDIPMEAVPTRDRAQGKGKGKAVSAKVSKKRATANDNTSAPPTKKRKPVATKGNLPQVVGEAAGTFVIANETPSARQALSGENIPEDAMSLNPLSRATRSSTRKTQVLSDWRTASTTIGTPADAVSSKVNPSLRMSPRKSHPHLEPSSSAVDDSLTAVNETAAEQAAAGAIDSLQAVSSVREASPAFSELSELTELSA